MEAWQSALLYSFLSYILFHLVVGDIVHFVKAFRGHSDKSYHQNQYTQDCDVEVSPLLSHLRGFEIAPAGIVVGDVESGGTKMSTPQPFLRKHGTSEQRSLVLVLFKICDVVLYCLMGYFHTFTVCWCACLTCLDSLISKYIAFLDSMVKSLTAYPAVAYLSATAVSCMALCCVVLYIIYSPVH